MTGRRSFLVGSAALLGVGIAVPAQGAGAFLLPVPTPTGPAGMLTVPVGRGRTAEVHVWGPAGRAGTILFSHGAGSSPRFYDRFLRPWADAGFRILAPLHVDSREHPRNADFQGMQSWRARLEDMHALADRIGEQRWIAAGHSYGGLTALVMGGAAAIAPEGWEGALGRTQVAAAIALSPPAPIPALITEAGYAKLRVPALVQTGTRDIVPGITTEDGEGWKGHLAPYAAAAAGGDRYALVLDGVDHYFGGAICRHDLPGPMQLDRLADAAAITTLFAQAFGTDGANAGRSAIDARLSEKGPVRLTRR